jgi:hypothetical protein
MIKIGSKLKILKTANKATALLPNGKISKVASMEDKSEYSNDFIYFIARALTANVPNANGDYFPDDELEKSYESFIGKNLHLNHDADDVAKAVGKIIDAWFVRTDGDIYVVCLCKIDKKLHPELARNIETGIIDSVSMGCSCQECECSICGCKAHNESEMCEHLKNFLGREIDVNGQKQKVSSINRGITFNELSLVGDPADSNAHMYQIYANKRSDGMNKKAMQDGKTEDVVQEEVKQEIEKTLKDKEETEKETKAEVKEEIKEVKEEIKETVEQLDQAKEVIEEKKEKLKELKEEVKDIKEEKVEEIKEEVKEETKEETVEKEESCKKEEECKKEESCKKAEKYNEISIGQYKVKYVPSEDKIEIYRKENDKLINSFPRTTVISRGSDGLLLNKGTMEFIEDEDYDKLTNWARKLYEEKLGSAKKAETEEEIKDIEEIKEKAKEAIEEDKKENGETEVKEETKEEVVEEKKEEETSAETVEEVKEKVEDIKEEVMAEIGDIFSPVKDETKEFKITDIFEDNGEKFVETEVEGKKKVYALKNVKLRKKAEEGETEEEIKEELQRISDVIATSYADSKALLPTESDIVYLQDHQEEIKKFFPEDVDLWQWANIPEEEWNNKDAYAKTKAMKKQAEAPAKPTTAPSAGMKWVFNQSSNIWEQKPENTKTVEVQAEEKAEENKIVAEYKYTLIKAGKQPRWLVIDKATNKIAQKLFLKDLPQEANSFDYKKVIASAIKEVGLNKVANKLSINKKAIKVNDKYELYLEGQDPKTLVIENIYINEDAKETFVKTQIDGAETDDNIFTVTKFIKMIEDGELKKVEQVKEEIKEEEKVIEETAVNDVETTEDTVPMNQDETSEPMNDLQSSTNKEVEKKASFWEVKKDEKTGKYYLESPKGKYQDAEGHTYKFNSREDALEEIDFLDAEHKYKKEMKTKKEGAAGDGELMPQSDPIPEFKVVPEVKPNDANTLTEEVIEKEITPMEEVANLMSILEEKLLANPDETANKVEFVKKELQDAIDFVDGKPIEEIENDEEEIAEFSDIKWEQGSAENLPMVASVDVDDINWNNINARRDGAMILAHIYKAKPLSFKVAFKKVNKMNKVASKANKVSFIGILKEQVALAKQEVETMKITAQVKEKRELCDGIVKQAMAKGLVHIDNEEIKKNILKGMSQLEAREMAVKKAADEQVKNLMAMDKTQINAYKETVANFSVPTFKVKKHTIGRICASADYDEKIELPWSRKR